MCVCVFIYCLIIYLQVMDSYLSLLALAQTDMGKKVVDFDHTKMTSIIEGSFRIKKRDGSRKNMKEVS